MSARRPAVDDAAARSAARTTRGVLGALLAAGVALRFYRLDAQSLWLDELWTAVAGDPRLPLDRWLTVWVLPDVHPPLYQFLVRQWQVVAGNGELSLRLPSALLSAGLVVLVPLVQRWTPVTRQPLALAAWFACSTGAVLYAREARAYALLLLLAAAATLLGVAIGRRMERGERVGRPVAALAAIVVVAEYSHYFGALVGGGVFGALCLFAVKRDPRYLARLAAAGTATLAVLAPWLAMHLPYLSEKSGGYFWIQNNWSVSFPDAAGYAAGTPAMFVAAVAAAAAAAGLRRPALGRAQCFVPLVMLCLMAVAALAVSLHTPVVTPRNLLVLMPPFYLLVIASFDGLLAARRPVLRIAGAALPAALIAASLGFAFQNVLLQAKDDWRAAGAYIASLPGCRDAPLPVNFWPPQVYAYYLPEPYREGLLPVTVQSMEAPPPRFAAAGRDQCPLVLWSAHMTGDGVVRRTLRALDLSARDVVIRRFRGHLLVLDRPGTPAGRSGAMSVFGDG